MPVGETSRQQLLEHLERLGVSRGRDLVVHARLISLGKIDVATVVEVLQHAVGPTATIAMPAFTLNLREHDVFDAERTPPENVGALPRFFATLPGIRRSSCPMHSYMALGPKANAIAAADPAHSMGPGAAMAKLRELEFTLLLLGCSFQEGATQVHQVEAEFGVPYREWMLLPRTVRDAEGGVRKLDVHYYGRRTNSGVTLDLDGLQRELAARGYTTSAQLPYGRSHLLSLSAFHEGAESMLRLNPYAFVASKP